MHINYASVQKRIERGTLTVNRRGGQESPLRVLEPLLVETVIAMEALGKPLHPSQVCELVMDFVGDGTPLARALLDYQKRHKTVGADATEPQQVSNGWYTGFLERNQEQIQSKKPKAHDIKRKEWALEILA